MSTRGALRRLADGVSSMPGGVAVCLGVDGGRVEHFLDGDRRGDGEVREER
ncbi:MAG: hypothetical protein ACRDZ4_02335 [Egibacteraceae bacterium]